MMFRRVLPLALVLVMAGASAHAQIGGAPGDSGPGSGIGGSAMGGGAGGRHGGHGRQAPGGSSDAPPTIAQPPPPKPPKPENQIEIVGVVQALDPAGRQVTIAYDAVDGLGWPRGTLQFGVYKADLLKGVTVGERVQFHLDSQQIVDIGPYTPRHAPVAPPALAPGSAATIPIPR
jgi:hypothetical protein